MDRALGFLWSSYTALLKHQQGWKQSHQSQRPQQNNLPVLPQPMEMNVLDPSFNQHTQWNPKVDHLNYILVIMKDLILVSRLMKNLLSDVSLSHPTSTLIQTAIITSLHQKYFLFAASTVLCSPSPHLSDLASWGLSTDGTDNFLLL